MYEIIHHIAELCVRIAKGEKPKPLLAEIQMLVNDAKMLADRTEFMASFKKCSCGSPMGIGMDECHECLGILSHSVRERTSTDSGPSDFGEQQCANALRVWEDAES